MKTKQTTILGFRSIAAVFLLVLGIVNTALGTTTRAHFVFVHRLNLPKRLDESC